VDDDVQVWAAWLDVQSEEMPGLWSSLSPDERARAGRFAQESDRVRFVAARGLLRAILGSCLGTERRKIEFAYSAKGKPLLTGDFTRSGLQFNLAHSGGLGVFAVARHGAVGVDVEQVRAVPDLSGLTERFFSARECAEIGKLSGEAQTMAFFRIWTRKEAWLKTTGEGITGSPQSIEVLGPPGEEELCGAPQDGSRNTRFSLHDLQPAPGFLGALAVTPQPARRAVRLLPDGRQAGRCD
jgi:4'-phosphopantetheinyl transferase